MNKPDNTIDIINDVEPVDTPISINDLSDVSDEEWNLNEAASIRDALAQTYEPIREDTLRIVEVQRRVSRIPNIEPLILNALIQTQKALARLEKRQLQINEDFDNTTRIYNATIYDLNTDKYVLSTPMQIVLIEESDETIARIPELNLYAIGDSGTEAIYELKDEIINLYEDLISSENKLGPLPESWLKTLNKLIVATNG